MTERTPEPPLEERVASLEATVGALAQLLDTALTANEVLQTRYGQIMDAQAVIEGLTTRLDAPEA